MEAPFFLFTISMKLLEIIFFTYLWFQVQTEGGQIVKCVDRLFTENEIFIEF